jgi:iron complex transport system ATP-binding protein
MIKGENISFSIGEKCLLNQVDFTAQYGEFIGVVGPNGAGKSTLLNVIAGIAENYKGTVFYNEKPLKKITNNELSALRAYLPQQTNLEFDFTVQEVVEMGRYWAKSKSDINISQKAIDYALNFTGLLPLKNNVYTKLSGGEKQRTQIARILAQVYSEPFKNKIILLDEPLNNLDLKYQHQLLTLCYQLAGQGNLVIAVIHDLNLAAQFCDKLMLLAKGALVKLGSAQNVIIPEILSEAYDYPVNVYLPKGHKNPFVIFGNAQKEEAALQDLIANGSTDIKKYQYQLK